MVIPLSQKPFRSGCNPWTIMDRLGHWADQITKMSIFM